MVEFTPMAGLLNIGRKVADAFGLGSLWEGNDNLEGVSRQFLAEFGIPEQPIQLQAGGVTPRQVAERAGIIRRRRRVSPKTAASDRRGAK